MLRAEKVNSNINSMTTGYAPSTDKLDIEVKLFFQVSKTENELFTLIMFLLFLKVTEILYCSFTAGLVFNTVSRGCNCYAFNIIYWPCWPWGSQ